jgi:hypothetical protein
MHSDTLPIGASAAVAARSFQKKPEHHKHARQNRQADRRRREGAIIIVNPRQVKDEARSSRPASCSNARNRVLHVPARRMII